MNIVGMIPARMGSSRFPGKPLAKICSMTMIEHVYKRSALSKHLKEVYVATCDQEIKDAVEAFGGKAVMTKDTHERASDRVAEAMIKVEKESKKEIDVLVMIQGDEPMVFPEMIDKSVEPIIEDRDVQVVNLMAKIKTKKEQEDINEIKVVVDKESFALYFSRAAIPMYRSKEGEQCVYKQVCIIPFTREYLIRFNGLEPTPLEIAESVDMLRFLEHGDKVKMVLTEFDTYSVDTLEDLKKVEQMMEKDSLFQSYKQ